MRKILALLLAGMMLSSLCFPAWAEKTGGTAGNQAETVPALMAPELLDLWDFGGESMSWLASAVPISEGVALASPSVLPANTEQIAVSDGVNTWEVKAILPDKSGLLAILFFDPSENTERYDHWQLMPYGENAEATACFVRCADSMGSRINRDVLAVENITWREQSCLLLTLSGPAPAGSALLTEDGWLAGLVAGEWAEGENRVVALSTEMMAQSLNTVVKLLAYLPFWCEAPEGLAVSMDGNYVTMDWSAMNLPEPPAGENWYLVFSDTGNNYLTYYEISGETSVHDILTPGRFYAAGMMISARPPDSMPDKLRFFFVPYAKPLTDHDFKAVRTAIVLPDSDGKIDPEAEVTEEILRSSDVSFWSQSTYNVKKEISGLPLLVTLTDPNGNNYRWTSSWVYSPLYMNEDIWSVKLKETGLTVNLDMNGYPSGIYEVAYYVNGDLADSFEFELK